MGSYNHPCDNFLQPVSKSKAVSVKTRECWSKFPLRKVTCAHHYSVFNYMITHYFHSYRRPEGLKLWLFSIIHSLKVAALPYKARLGKGHHGSAGAPGHYGSAGAPLPPCRAGPEGFVGLGTINPSPAKHTALGHALRKENSSDKTSYILCLCSSLCLKKLLITLPVVNG